MMRQKTRQVCVAMVVLGWMIGCKASVLSEQDIVEIRYRDGVSSTVSSHQIREAQPTECGALPHLLQTDQGDLWCGQYHADKLLFNVQDQAQRVSQSYGNARLEGYDLPSPRTAILNYELVSGSQNHPLNYELMANQRPGVQFNASQVGSISQAYVNLYRLDSEQFGFSSSVAIRQWRIGQMVTDAGPLASSLGQGVEWRKSSRLAQNNVQVFSGRLVSDTELTVLVNNQPRVTLPVQAGDVSIYNVPLVEGNNQVAVIYRNEKGELVQVNRNIFFSQALQPKGRWEGAASLYRDTRLNHWAAQAQIEKGVTQALTVQAGARVNIHPGEVMAPVSALQTMRAIKPTELAFAVRSMLGGGFLSAGYQTETAYGPGVQRIGYAHGSQLLYLEKALGPAKIGISLDPRWLLSAGSPAEPDSAYSGWRVGYMCALQGPEFEYTVSRFFRTELYHGGYMSLYCKTGRDGLNASLQYCGVNANMALDARGFNSPNPLLGGLSYSKANAGDARNLQARQESLNGFLQTRDSFLLVSEQLSYARTRHDFQHISLGGQLDSTGRGQGSISGIVGLDYGQQPKILGLLPKDTSSPADVLVAMEGLQAARDLGYSAVQSRINGQVSINNLNSGALVGQHNQILVNPESVDMDSPMGAIRLKISPALSGIYKVDGRAQ
ncbi:hypothetical protein NQT62_11720 [Limnobacter humi]|uniref:Uncharacterized protein n=1 Tax=Limnobacter humi TaxID=1778671 RepID=A0ABT1WHV5_9BURK|nr:hypothetical protein [Limnobacter humi]MCQ8897102.1 hypothetical protein [Limnobacter humi]